MQREIGGYFELERFTGPMLHEGAVPLNCGRAALRLLILRKGIRRLALPDFLCNVVDEACRDVEVIRYPVGMDLRPLKLPEPDGRTALYLVNYYGQLAPEELEVLGAGFPVKIVDNTQAYFDSPVPRMDTLYTCRKFFGVSDGAFLYTDADPGELPQDESHGRMGFVLGRVERPAGEFYPEAHENNDRMSPEPHRMSRITENLLHAVDYDRVRTIRTENFLRLHRALGQENHLTLRVPDGAFAYPLLIPDGGRIRRGLIEQKIFVSTLWGNVIDDASAGEAARFLAENILPLPCDQRYGVEEMDRIIDTVRVLLDRKEQT